MGLLEVEVVGLVVGLVVVVVVVVGLVVVVFSAYRRIAANSRDQSVRIPRATYDYCTFRGPIC